MSVLVPVPTSTSRAMPMPTADQLRSYLMRVPCGRRAAGRPESGPVVPAGLVDVREAAPRIVMLPSPPWSDPDLRVLVRTDVAERLRKAADTLPEDLRLGFWEGLRPIAVQASLWESGLQFLRASYPQANADDLEMTLERFVARPYGVIPPHSTGSAIDVAAVDVFGRVLNPADAWGRLGNEILARALRDTGLANYEVEWWHWSYGDEEWARAYDCAPLTFDMPTEFDGPGGGI
jgi:zinc D-Ala-D-Ala dipeptidase